MKITDLLKEDGRIVKGVNTTVDVGPNEIAIQAKKFGNTVDKDGRPPTLSKKVKGKSTNVLFNLGLAEGIQLKFQRGDDFDTLHIKPKGKNRVELRGKPGYESGNYDAQDKLHQVLDNLGKAANFAELMNGETVTINPKHPDGERAKKTAQDVLSTENWTPMEKALMEGGHSLDDYYMSEAQELGASSEIYVDMDGVLADFFTEWGKLMGVENWWDINKEFPIEDALQKIRDTDRFWLELPLTPNAKNLLNLIKDVKGEYTILSSPLPGDENCVAHKKEWIEKNLTFFPPKEVIIRHDKETFATQPDGTPNILIDDYGVNVRKWEAAGGVGFKHKDHKFERTAQAIKQHMQEPVAESISRTELRKQLAMGVKVELEHTKNPKIALQIALDHIKEDPLYYDHLKFVENIADDIKFVEPNFEVEWDEAARYPEFQKIGKEAWIELAKKGKEFTIKSAKDINNTDAADPASFKTLDPAKQKRALAQLEKGEIEMPIVAVYSDDYKELVGGNTRLTAMMARDGQATVWAFYVPDKVAELAENFADGKKSYTREELPQIKDKHLENIDHEIVFLNIDEVIPVQKERVMENFKQQVDRLVQGIYSPVIVDCDNRIVNGHHRYDAVKLLGETTIPVARIPHTLECIIENFADGKKKGKSRPGRVKRSGASCKGSVTSLRKRAKNASGEKAKMYHWCANMKSGRKKK